MFEFHPAVNLVVALVIALLFCGAITWFLYKNIGNKSKLGEIANIIFQVGFSFFIISAFIFKNFSASIFGLLFFPISVPSYTVSLFFYNLTYAVLPYALIAFVLLLAIVAIAKPLRKYGIIICLIIPSCVAYFIGESVSLNAMCKEAVAMGVDKIDRGSLVGGMSPAYGDFGFGYRSEFEKDGDRFRWNYRDMIWNKMSQDAKRYPVKELYSCKFDRTLSSVDG